MSKERVLALLKAEIAVPEPLEPTPGHTPTRVFDTEEVANAQRESAEPPASQTKPSSKGRAARDTRSPALSGSSPEHKKPFEVMGSVPARPPNVPLDFKELEADRTERRRADRKVRLGRAVALLAMAAAVFTTTFLLTKGLRDEAARARTWELITEIGAKLGSIFSSRAEPAKPKTSADVLRPVPHSESDSQRARAEAPAPVTQPAPPPVDPASPRVVRLEDLALLDECSGPECRSATTKSASKQRRAVRSRSR